jgi:hypothetical protein
VIGFAFEVIADEQKCRFKGDPANAGRFITTGLWSWSQHPNYFAEITLWTGILVIAIPLLTGWSWLVILSGATDKRILLAIGPIEDIAPSGLVAIHRGSGLMACYVATSKCGVDDANTLMTARFCGKHAEKYFN